MGDGGGIVGRARCAGTAATTDLYELMDFIGEGIEGKIKPAKPA